MTHQTNFKFKWFQEDEFYSSSHTHNKEFLSLNRSATQWDLGTRPLYLKPDSTVCPKQCSSGHWFLAIMNTLSFNERVQRLCTPFCEKTSPTFDNLAEQQIRFENGRDTNEKIAFSILSYYLLEIFLSRQASVRSTNGRSNTERLPEWKHKRQVSSFLFWQTMYLWGNQSHVMRSLT